VTEAPRTPIEDRILQATLGVIGRRGVRRLSMGEVSEAAGISRTTLYRYFDNKESLLHAVARYDLERFATGLEEALDLVEEGRERLDVVIRYIVDYIEGHPASGLAESEPGFVIAYIQELLPELRGILRKHLADTLEESAVVRDGVLGPDALVDVMVRLQATVWLLPTRERSHLVSAMRWLAASGSC
jgi:AcrR family transcriptional regulator